MSLLLVIGKEGQLAQSVAERGRNRQYGNVELAFAGRPELELLKPATVEREISRIRPDIVLNAAAYTAVDRAETEPDKAFAINCAGAQRVAEAAGAIGARIIHVSTDYVFDGNKPAPYVESDPAAPGNVYGLSKLQGEQLVRSCNPAHLILRSAWVYSPYGNNFVKTVLRLAGERDRLKMVSDQRGSPTSALDLADAILCIVESWDSGSERGIGQTYHCAGNGDATWYEMAREIMAKSRLLGGPFAEIDSVATAELSMAAARPANSRLDCTAFERDFSVRMPDWRVSLAQTVERLLPQYR